MRISAQNQQGLEVNLFVIGASKCGTTFLHDALNQHPAICMSATKEPYLFWGPDYLQKIEAIEKLFLHCGKSKVVGESSPIYTETIQFPEIPGRIYQYNPGAKLIYLVREPFSRLRSVFRQTLASGHWSREEIYSRYKKKMPLNYSAAVFEYPPLLDATKYWTHIEKFRNYFPDSAIKVVLFEKLASDTLTTLQDVFRFLGVEENVPINFDSAEKNAGEGKTVYNPWLGRFRKLLPGALLRALPEGAKRLARNTAQALPVPDAPPAILSAEDETRVREILAPEVEGIYRYLGINDDPWDFFEAAREGSGAVSAAPTWS